MREKASGVRPKRVCEVFQQQLQREKAVVAAAGKQHYIEETQRMRERLGMKKVSWEASCAQRGGGGEEGL